MKFLTVIFSVLALSTAIRVPIVWPENTNTIRNFHAVNTHHTNFSTINNFPTKGDVKKINSYVTDLKNTADGFYAGISGQKGQNLIGSQKTYLADTDKLPNTRSEYIQTSDNHYSDPTKSKHQMRPHVRIPMRIKSRQNNHNNRNVPRHNELKSNFFSQPLVYTEDNTNLPKFADGWIPIVGQPNYQQTQESSPSVTFQNHKKTQDLNQKINHQSHRMKQNVDYNVLNHQTRQKTQEIKQKINHQNNKKVDELNNNVNHQSRQKKQDLNKKVNHQNYQKTQDLNHNINNQNHGKIQSLNHNANHQKHQQTLIRSGNQHSLQTHQHKIPNSGLNRTSPNKYSYNPQQQSIINKNHRDDTTHENKTEDIDSDSDEIKFESLKTVPTAPIHPGESKWATRGIKHKPHASSHTFTPLIDNDQNKPEGYETFEKAVPVFERQSRKFSEKLRNFQQKHPNVKSEEDKTKLISEDDYNEKTYDDNEFVPTRTLAQVRNTDSKQYLPRDPEDYRLRKAVKDSRIHTVYTEEGYEDIAYDHEGHEKHAEDSEGHSRFQKNDKKSKQKLPKRMKSGFEAVDVEKEFENYSPPSEDRHKETIKHDVDVSASDYDAYRVPNSRIKVKMFRNQNMTKEIKNSDDGEMEITSEIKIMTKPNNVSTTHKFVKIVPKNRNRGTKRYKRYVNDFHKVNVKEDFLDVFATEKPKVTTTTNSEKYPYYNVNSTNKLNINSPLRYAEDLKNAPVKIAGKMSFYEQARLSECPEIPKNIDPLPDKIKKKLNKNEESENEDDGYTKIPDLPRLSHLGDKIDCLKTKLFGDNPLDSPLFEEKMIEEPEPIFEALKMLNARTTTKSVTAEGLKQQSDLVDYVQGIDELQRKLKLLPKPSEASLPDQIIQTTEKIISTTASVPHFGNPTFQNDDSKKIINNSKLRLSKALNLTHLNKENATNLNGSVARLNTINSENKELPPTAEALRVLLKRRKRPQRPLNPIFDINKFLPSPLPPIPTFFTSTILPKYKTLSEVYYKDEIQPNEQLNVFADVINNIKNSPKETLTAESTNYFPVVQETWASPDTKKNTSKNIKIPPRRVRIKNKDSSGSHSNIKSSIYKIATTTTTTSTTTSTTTPSPRYRRTNKYKNHKSNSQIFEEYLQTVKQNVDNFYDEDLADTDTDQTTHDKKKHKPYETNSNLNDFDEITSFYNPILNQEISTGFILDDVVGLSPPAPISSSQITTLNTYVVSGMKPPKVGKPYIYSSFRIPQNNRVRRKNYYHRRSKRSPLKTTYSEIKRNRPSQQIKESFENEEENDDYVPKRNRNFHYDVENDRVVYLNNKQNEQKETVAETQTEKGEEEIGDDEEYLTIVKPSMKPFVLVTTEANGPSFLDYIQRLKNDSSYRPIKEPEPKEKLKEKPYLMNWENITSRQIDTAEVPGFLSIISKLKTDGGYKEIKEKKEKSTSTPSLQIDTSEIDEEEKEADPKDENQTQRSGFRNTASNLHNIFDINEYLPQPEDYTVKTVIDYSKYKTIQRAPVTRHNLSSRYNSEENDFPESRNITQLNLKDNIEKESESKTVYQNIRRTGYSSSEEIEKSAIPTTSRSVRIRTRNRIRQTPKPVTTTTSTPETTRKRARFRSRPTTTTESSVTTQKPTEKRKSVRRRVERVNREESKVPSNHKPYYSPIAANDEKLSPRGPSTHKKRKVPGPSQMQQEENKQLDEDERAADVLPNKLLQVEVFQKYDPNKRHGGNYRKEEDLDNSSQAVEVNSVSPNVYKDNFDVEVTERLSDIVPKPFAFYSDPMLPKTVNHLKNSKQTDNAEDSDNIASAKPEKNYNDEVVINFNENTETLTKKPIQFVKDPSKRLYFYVPVK